jgi:A/G-specific adenine glycosylase
MDRNRQNAENAFREEVQRESCALTGKEIANVRRKLLQWYRTHSPPDYPWRHTDNPWHALLAEFLLLRTRADAVEGVYRHIVTHYPEPGDLAALSLDEIASMLYPLGLRWKAPLLKALAAEIAGRKGRIPEDQESLEQLPGVGPYVVAAFLSLHLGRRALIIDSNTVRFLCRYTGRTYDGETRRKKWVRDLLDALTPDREVRTFNYALLDFCREICRPRNPLCMQCPLRENCAFYRNRQIDQS